MMPRRSVADLLRQSVDTGLLPDGVDDAARGALVKADLDDMPWYLRVLTGGAAWVGALFLLATGLGMISVLLGERVDLAAVALGLALMPAGVVLRARGHGEFQRQASLVSVIAGQMLVVGAVSSLLHGTDVAAVALVITSLPLILRFDDAVYRFSATLAVIGAVLFLAVDAEVPRAMGIITACTAALPVLVWRVAPGLDRWHRVLDPVAWGSATACCGLLTFQTIVEVLTGTIGHSPRIVAALLPSPWPLTILFTALLVWLALRVARDHGTSPMSPTLLAVLTATAMVAGLTHATPAVLGALLLIALGFDRRRPGLVAMAAAFLVGFLGLHYYSLSMTLLQKSAVLVGSGLVCLACAAVVRARLVESAA